MISFYVSVGLSIVALILGTIVMTLIWERNRVFRQAQQQASTPGIPWVRNSVNLG